MDLFVFGDLDHFEVHVSGPVDPADHAALSRTVSTLPADVPMLVEFQGMLRGDLAAVALQVTSAAAARTAPTEIRHRHGLSG